MVPIHVRLLEGGEYNGFQITPEVLKQVWENFKTPVPLRLDHSLHPTHVVGRVEPDNFEDGVIYGKMWLSTEGWSLLIDNKVTGLSPELELYDTGWTLTGVGLLSSTIPAIPNNGIRELQVSFSIRDGLPSIPVERKSIENREFREVEKDTYVSFFDKSLLREDNIDFKMEWDADEARKAIVEKFGWEMLAKTCGAVLFHEGENTNELPEAYGRYKFPMATVKNGDLVFVWRGIAAAVQRLGSANPELKEVVEPAVRYAYEFATRVKEEKEKEESDNMSMSAQSPPDSFKDVIKEAIKEAITEQLPHIADEVARRIQSNGKQEATFSKGGRVISAITDASRGSNSTAKHLLKYAQQYFKKRFE